MDLALFDLDHTILDADSDYLWAQFLIAQGVLDEKQHQAQNDAFYADYQQGRLDIDAFLRFQLAALAAHPRAQLDCWHRQFMTDMITPKIRAQAVEQIENHRRKGDLIALVTATNSFVTAPIARMLGIEHLLATIAAQDADGQFNGQPRGTPAFRAGKQVRVDAWLESLGLHWQHFERSWFYSDSHNDLPLLETVSNPVAVTPDETLLAHAKAHNWTICQWQ